jgi:hypothetical protein
VTILLLAVLFPTVALSLLAVLLGEWGAGRIRHRLTRPIRCR